MCFAPQRRALFLHRNFQKWPEHVVIFTFLFKTCFAPQWRTLFRHCNVQKWSETDVFCHFLLPNVLRATTACTFSISQRLKVLRSWNFWLQNVLRTTTVLPFCAAASSLFWLSPSLIFSISYLLPSDFLHAWASSWLCFSCVHTVGSFTPKLPSKSAHVQTYNLYSSMEELHLYQRC